MNKSLTNFYLNSVKGRPSAEVFMGMFCVFSLLQRRMDEYFRPFELTPIKFLTLMLIRHLGGPTGLSQNDIGHHMIVTPSNITRLIDRLLVDGYAERKVSKDDRRVKLITITKKGGDILDHVFPGFGEMIQQAVYLIERKEAEELSQLLLKWFSKLEAQDPKQGGAHE